MMKYWIVDAFTKEQFRGNPAAVCIVDEWPKESLMQTIAGEFNLSETAFAKQSGPTHFELRWFTPKCEVDLCGHATLATSVIIFDTRTVGEKCIEFKTRSGILKVEKDKEYFILDLPSQGHFSSFSGELDAFDQSVKIVSTVKALDDLIVEIDSDEVLRKLTPNIEKLAKIDCRGIIVTARASSGQSDFISRFFAPKVGVNEDPVTGSAHCKLAPYWATKLGKNTLKAYQASERGGWLDLELSDDRVKIKGNAVISASGELNLSNQN